jgi:hypothetical protein
MQCHFKVLAAISPCLVLFGCVGAPTVKYVEFRANDVVGSDAAGSIKFALYGSIVTLVDGSQVAAPPAAAAGGAVKNTPADPIAAAAAVLKADKPKDIAKLSDLVSLPAKAVVSKKLDNSIQYALVPDESFYYKPNISVTYLPNTYSIKTLGAAAEDNRVQIVQEVSGILTAAIPLLAFDAAPTSEGSMAATSTLELPVVIDLTPVDFSAKAAGSCVGDPDATSDVNNWCPITGTAGGWKFIVNAKRLTPGTVDAESFFSTAATSSVRTFPVPSCQSVTLSIRQEGPSSSKHMDFDIIVANQRRLATFLIPAKGSISPGDICGADLSVTSSTSSSALDIASAIATQAAAIQKAIQSKDSKTTSPATATGTKPVKAHPN